MALVDQGERGKRGSVRGFLKDLAGAVSRTSSTDRLSGEGEPATAVESEADYGEARGEKLSATWSGELQALARVATRFTRDPKLGLGPTDTLRAYERLMDLHAAEHAARGPAGPERELNPEVRRYYWFALAAYGPAALRAWQIIPPVVGGMKSSFAWLCNIPQEDIVMSGKPSCEVHFGRGTCRMLVLPAYCLAIDRASRSIVVAFRGADHPGELLAEVPNSTVRTELANGEAEAHAQYLLLAQELFKDITAVLCKELVRHVRYDAVLVGHSSGGAVAALLCELWAAKKPFGVRTTVRCFTYGAPPVLDAKAAAAACPRITSVVLRCDAVPRLSRHTLEKMAKQLSALKHDAADLAAVRAQAGSEGSGPKLFVPGSVVCLDSAGDEDIAYDLDAEQLQELLLLAPQMFASHWPDRYMRALLRAQGGLGQAEGRERLDPNLYQRCGSSRLPSVYPEAAM